MFSALRLRRQRMLKCAQLVPVCLALMSVAANAASLDAIFSFRESTGGQPYSPATFDNVIGRQSILYTAAMAGPGDCYKKHGCGAIVKLTPPAGSGAWKAEVLRKLKVTDGVFPHGGVLIDSFGVVYGVNIHGGLLGCHDRGGCGTIYKLTPPASPDGGWTYTLIYSFQGGPDGEAPIDSLTFDTFGSLYGVTFAGGAFGRGTIFKLAPASNPAAEWMKTKLHDFHGADGARPRSQLTFDTAGAMYGVTELGGANNKGTVFKLSPPRQTDGQRAITVLHSFGGSGDGALPAARVIFDTKGALYGTAAKGGVKDRGVAYQLTPPGKAGGKWSYSRYQFEGDNGRVVAGGLSFDTSGALYGTTQRGGPGDCQQGECGTLFRLVPPKTSGDDWQHEMIGAFDGVNGGKPLVTPVFHRGKIYGTAHHGGTSDIGTIFEYAP